MRREGYFPKDEYFPTIQPLNGEFSLLYKVTLHVNIFQKQQGIYFGI